MDKTFSLQNKIIWRSEIEKDLSKAFYPSVYKDMCKKQSFFEENFSWKIYSADRDKINNIFLPIYKKEIASRNNYTLDRENIAEKIFSKLDNNPSDYRLLCIKDNKENVLGVTLFSIKGKVFYMAYRAFKRFEDKSLSRKATLDYWGEKIVRDFSFDYGGLELFSHGKDSHPYNGRRIGLALYKIKVGTRPMQAFDYDSGKSLDFIDFKEEYFIQRKEPVLFFYNPGKDNYFLNCNLYFPKDSLHHSFVNEFKSVMEWAKIDFEYLDY